MNISKSHQRDAHQRLGILIVIPKLYDAGQDLVIQINTTNKMRDMIRDWKPKTDNPDYTSLYDLIRNQNRDSVAATAKATGEAYKQIYK